MRKRAPVIALRPTLGPLVCRWIEANLVHGEGDFYGKPFRLRQWQRAFIYEAYELQPDGTRVYDRALLGIPKGNGKTELAAAIACAELGGPVVFAGWKSPGVPLGKRRKSPDIPIAAASFEQADKLFGAARIMIKFGRLAEYFDVFDTEILEKSGPGKMYRVAAVAGTNDGGRPTFFSADEVHEWTGNKERVHLVLSNGRAKRADSWELNISTAGQTIHSLLGRMVQHGRDVRSGKVKDDRFLFVWYELPADSKLSEDLSTSANLKAAIRIANPAAGDFISVDSIAARYKAIPEHEFRRYYLNQWTDAPERWLPSGSWEKCASKRDQPDDEAEIVLSLEGNSARESVALVAATVEAKPHIFVVEYWEKGPTVKKIAVADVEQAVRDACQKWEVRGIAINPARWPQTIEAFEEEDLPLVEFESHQPKLMVTACQQFYDAVEGRTLTNDGDERMTTHLADAVVKEDARGRRLTKPAPQTAKATDAGATTLFIELAVAAVVAFDLVTRVDELDNDDSWRPIP